MFNYLFSGAQRTAFLSRCERRVEHMRGSVYPCERSLSNCSLVHHMSAVPILQKRSKLQIRRHKPVFSPKRLEVDTDKCSFHLGDLCACCVLVLFTLEIVIFVRCPQ